jgi:hypothetical protein
MDGSSCWFPLWLPHPVYDIRGIEAGDLGSHVYNAWLAQLIERGQAPGLYLVTKWSNVLFDLAIGWTTEWMGLPEAEKLVVPIFVLIFFWGCFALISAASRKPAWYLTPAIAMLTFLDLLLQVGVDRIMFSADYPYGSMAQARAFLEQLPVSVSDRTRIAHGNAERLLGL